MRLSILGTTKIKLEMNRLRGSFSILENHKLHRRKDLYKVLCKILMTSIIYKRIKSYAKPAGRKKKVGMSLNETQ